MVGTQVIALHAATGHADPHAHSSAAIESKALMSNTLSDPPWWHPIRSPMLRPTWGQQALAVVFSLLVTGGTGRALAMVLGDGAGSDARLSLAVIAFVLTFAVMFSWVGHLLGALVLQGLLPRGQGGWAVVALAGGAVGVLLSTWVGMLAVILAPVLALLQLALLRALIAQDRPQ